MESYQLVPVAGGGLSVEGIPDGVKLIALTGAEAKRLAHLTLHQSDLDFAKRCLVALQKYDEKEHVEAQALWRAAIIYCVKCFMGNGNRARLKETTVLGDEPVAQEWLRYFTDLRNKHLVHDVNSFSQCAIFAVLNDGARSYKVAKVLASAATFSTITQTNFDSLYRLVEKSMKWVERECDLLLRFGDAPRGFLLRRIVCLRSAAAHWRSEAERHCSAKKDTMDSQTLSYPQAHAS